MGFEQVDLEEGEKQHVPLDAKQKEWTHIIKVIKNQNGSH
jgi:predicted DNA-binding antitoxin AbrB/MazE fold protein